MNDSLVIAGREFRSRLLIGTGKYRSFDEMRQCHEASGAEVVTVAVRRVNLDRTTESLLDYIDPKQYFLLPNTAACYTADEAIRTARLLSNQAEYEAWAYEIHHSAKQDAPSGTLLKLVEEMKSAGWARAVDVASNRAGAIPGTGGSAIPPMGAAASSRICTSTCGA